ncbi:organic solute transporter subunit alpha-like [Protopterus annectens]|uniref:organic solute transporter subunit alpha-like n=1 Tax=Protopterus annectens TaxID=7888 RepID=UPI001CF9C52C|nr:organic solute transporter subunit alpha-like [Protopterus annectens]
MREHLYCIRKNLTYNALSKHVLEWGVTHNFIFWAIDIITPGLDASGTILIIISSILALTTYGLFIEIWVYLRQNIKDIIIKDLTLTVLGLFPIVTVCCQLGMYVPRAASLLDLVAAISLAAALYSFFHLTVRYLGGVSEMIDKLQYVQSRLNVGPCCCCFVCLPTFTMNWKIYGVLRIAILQSLILQPLLHIISAVIWADGKYFQERVNVHNPLFYIGIMMAVSTLLSFYVFNLLLKSAFMVEERRYHLVAKYVIIIVSMIIITVQPLILESLTAYNVIPCMGVFNWDGRGSEIDHQAKILEMFVLLLVSRRFYRKSLPESLSLNFDNPLHTIP